MRTNGVLISPMDFSGSKKSWYLHALRLFIEAGKMDWPKIVVGIRSDLTNYDPTSNKKISQDIVATMAMTAFAIRSYFYIDPADFQNQEVDNKLVASHRETRSSYNGRTKTL